MENKIKNHYRSSNYYREISGIQYTKVEEDVHYHLVHHKGEIKERKLFGFTLSTKVYHEDVYFYKDSYEHFLRRESQIPDNKFIKNNVVYKKGKVRVYDKYGGCETYLFDDDEKAEDFITDILSLCRMHGNELS